MIPRFIIHRLKKNWGDRHESLACNAEARLYDCFDEWACYLIAINPENENEVFCIIVDHDLSPKVFTAQTEMIYLLHKWDREGGPMILDESFIPRKADTLFKILLERNP